MSEALFFMAGAGMLFFLPFISQENFWMWVVPKSLYFAGLIIYLINLRK